ncbi:MAG: 3-deoxy-7-phosphoheptulonate synthase [Ignavibacteriales bacterium]|nr:3-deoxy-7-phosphoheptulonate synthase [Ignavibacteriales bacterium]
MLVILKLDAAPEHVSKICEKIQSRECTAHVIPGAQRVAIGVTGNMANVSRDDFLRMESVVDVVRVSKKYKLVSREMKPDDSVIDVQGEKIGGSALQIIAGPCSVESRQQLHDIAGPLREMGIKFFRAGAYKPRTSPYAFQGMKEKGLELLDEIKKEYGMRIVTELKDSETLEQVLATADILQIGARNMQNFSLLEKIGQTCKPVFLKRGLAASIEDLLMSAEYILSQGNYEVILCERGIRTFETMTRNTLDLNAIPVIRATSHLPVFVDPSHGIGIWDMVPPMAMAGVACGANGLMIEVHNKPEEALSDGFQSLTLKNMKALLEKLKELAPIVGKTLECK